MTQPDSPRGEIVGGRGDSTQDAANHRQRCAMVCGASRLPQTRTRKDVLLHTPEYILVHVLSNAGEVSYWPVGESATG